MSDNVMLLDEIEEDEWALSQILDNPVTFREFINEDDPNWQPLEMHERAWTACTAHYVAMCCGRSVHKTTSMIEMLYYWVINEKFIRGDPGLLVMVPNKAQKDLSFFRIRSACLNHWLIRQYVSSNNINVTEGKIEFKNTFQFLMRIAGAKGTDANVIGIHTMRVWVDEAQEFPWQTWLSLQNCLKVEIDNFQMTVSGVPNGERKDNVLFECDQVDEKYVSFNISQAMMTWWTPEFEYQKKKEYHALQEESEDYKHYVLGQHGVPTFSIFDRTRFVMEDYEVPRIVLTQKMYESARRVDPDGVLRYHIEEAVSPVPALPLTEGGVKPLVGLGYDVGYSPDPAVFFIMYQHSSGVWRNLARFVLQRVEYALQSETLAFLDRIYNFNFIGIDMGGPGKPQYQALAGELTIYKEFKYSERLYPVEFGGYITVAAKDEKDGYVEKKDQVKRVAVETVSRWVHEKRFSFSKADINLIEELERTKFSRTQTGDPVYRTEDDHQFAAMMCAVMAYENKFGPPIMIERGEFKPKLISAKWLDITPYGARV
jgi:hypothetical protein